MPAEASAKESAASLSAKPVIPVGVDEFYIRTSRQTAHYQPRIAGFSKLHFVDAKNKIDTWQDICLIAPAEEDGKSILWEKGENVPEVKSYLEKTSAPQCTFDQLPAGLMQEKNYAAFEKSFGAYLYQNQELKIYQAPDLNMISKEGEPEADFRTRISLVLREKRDEMVKKLQDKYADKIAAVSEKIRRAQEKMSQKQQEAGMKKAETLISFGATVLGAFFGKGVTKGTISQAGTSMRRAGRITKESQEAAHSEEDYKSYQLQLESLQAELNKEIANLSTSGDSNSVRIETLSIRPRKSDISIEKVALVWCPFQPG